MGRLLAQYSPRRHVRFSFDLEIDGEGLKIILDAPGRTEPVEESLFAGGEKGPNPFAISRHDAPLYNAAMPKIHFADTKNADMFYLVRHTVADPFLFIEKAGVRHIYLNALELGAFKEKGGARIEAHPLEPYLAKASSLPGEGTRTQKAILLILSEHGLVANSVTVSRDFPLDLADYLRRNEVILSVGDIAPERARKDAREIESIRKACDAVSRAFSFIEATLEKSAIEGESLVRDGHPLTSEDLKGEVELLLYKEGFENPDGIIISSGIQAATPHHSGSGPFRPHQTIVCDIFPRGRESRYFSDMSRTYVKGKPSPDAVRMYEAVQEAQEAAFERIRSGIEAKEVHEAAAEVIRRKGFDTGDKGFIHGLGHGLGLEVHERPGVGPLSKEKLETGNVITVEPGLYYPEWGGVRLEDVVLVTETGCEKLSSHPRTLVVA